MNNNSVEHGIRSISSYLKLHGIQTQILFMGLGLDYKKDFDIILLKKIKAMLRGTDLVGIVTMSLGWPRAKTLIKYLKKNINAPIVIGGIHATVKPEECIQEVDYVCIGEGEKAFLALSKNMNKTRIPNMWIKSSKGIIKNEIGKLTPNLDEFGIPDYDLKTHFIYEKGKIVPFRKKHLLNKLYFIHTSRGCPHSCTYCINHFLRKLYHGKSRYMRYRSISNVIRELENMKKIFPGVPEVFISDDTFFNRRLEELEVFANAYKKKINIPFSCYASPLTLSKEKLDLLSDAGLKTLQIGVQTGSDRVNHDLYKRHMLREKVLKAAELVYDYKDKIMIDYQFIITNPYETREDLLDTLNLIKKMPKPFNITTFNLTYFYGTGLYNKAVHDKIIQCEEDTVVQFHFTDIMNHLRVKKLKESYLNSMLYWISGKATKTRYGFIPAFLFPIMTSRPVISICEFLKFPVFLMNLFVVRVSEFLKSPL
ncbi:B12-binding domain-containing radical SAM protein [Candidatus Woesearchaeota archaeon]|nr:B12-binding domain-containing radical SAM protein [Candidatus Woesearchaeota archaeon]